MPTDYSLDKVLGLFVGDLPVLSIICVAVSLRNVLFLVFVTNYSWMVLMLDSLYTGAGFTN